MLTAGSTSYVYGPDGVPIEQVSSDGTTLYLQADQLGSTRVITDSTGSTVATFTYGPYGDLVAKTGTADTRMRWGGQYQDPATGLYYLRARDYDPTTGEFLSADPLVELTGAPYAFGRDNPLNMTDPTGLITGQVCWTLSGGFGLGGLLHG
ncbi:RHS repeat-associated core domain-containing protein [Nocardioides ultimimeridianus]